MDRSFFQASHVPTIRCSACQRDLDLSSMANHDCRVSQHPSPHSLGSVQLATLGNMRAVEYDATFLKPLRPVLSKIDASVASCVAGEWTPASSNNGSIGSPVSATSARKFPWKAPKRTTTAMSQRPPSPELTNLDCAFPPFPTTTSKSSNKKNKSSTPASKTQASKSRPKSPASDSTSSNKLSGSLSHSRTPSTSSSRQRSDPLPGDRNPTRSSTVQGKRRPSLGGNLWAKKPSTDVVPPIPTVSSMSPPASLERAETAPGAIAAISSDIVAPKPGLHRFATANDIVALPDRKPPQRTPSYKMKAPAPILSNMSIRPGGRPSLAKSPITPQPGSGSSLGRSMTRIFGRSRSRSVSSRREIARAPLSDGSDEMPTPLVPTSAFESPRQAPLTPYTDCASDSAPIAREPFANECKDSLKALEGETDLQRPNVRRSSPQTPPKPAETVNFDFEWNKPDAISPAPLTSTSIAQRPTDPNRASVDSASSYGSVGFTERTASSRSSLPPSDELARKLSEVMRSSIVQPLVAEMPAPLRPRNPEVSAEMPTNPLFEDRTLSPIPAQDAFQDDSSHSRIDIKQKPVVTLHALRKDSLAGQSQSLEPHKGICRGCSKPILPQQKSVSSADGGLTGKFHKECFVCWTCKAPFSAVEIHVHADHPYCAYHYHELENSLCATCGKGIEGLYMETANVAGRGREKHHPHCLKCTTCQVQLNNDYFELSGKVYCEKDAFRLASVPRVHDRSPARPSPLVREYISSGNPDLLKGKNFPERRITRLMTTA